MAQSSGAKRNGKTRNGRVKLTRAEKKEARAARRQARRDSFRQMRQAFTLTRQNDARLIPYLVIAFVVVAAVFYLLTSLLTGSVWLPIFPAVLFGLLAALFLFSRRAQTSAYRQAEGQAGAAAYVLGQLRGDWRKTDAVAGTPQLDAVHRLLGRPGVVLIGEGAPQRVKPLLAQEKKRIARLAGDAPIYDVVVGRGEGEVPLAKLNAHLMKLPRNLSKEQVVALDRRLAALGTQRPAIPRGPMPSGVKMRSVQRAARRRG
ncbi:DUF4191 domain-containing protein [Jatrophihabitans sp.]|uniref:DUF4191 domain-containing protein n=1 Tax=Jatrophihabitans sp. TaxID=1932789 RepID=UPI002C05E330|nr:DUF4191 domain-containing protein [Jatrophihabitans sp.]